MVEIYGRQVEVKVGSVIKPDGWSLAQRLEDSYWSEAAFRIPTSRLAGITSIAVNVTITGRTLQRREGSLWVRVQIEFVGDGEPSTYHSGWMLEN